MNEFHLLAFKMKMETSLRELCVDALKNAQALPEMMHGMMVMTAAGNFCDGMKKNYPQLKKDFENLNQDIGLTEPEYKRLIDDITTKVLDEFIERPKDIPEDRYDDY